MNILQNYSLEKHNTFHLNVNAKYFCEINDDNDLAEVMQNDSVKNEKVLVLGEGANILFTKDFDGLVLKNVAKGIRVFEETDDYIILEVGGGEDWHQLVTYCVEHNWGGIENLALIPGTVGAAPVQNIAAYGQNFSDVFESLTAINLSSLERQEFSKAMCEFAYRDSFFKSKEPNKYFINKVKIKLSKKPILQTSYFETGTTYTSKGSLKQELELLARPPYTIQHLFQAIINIRIRKLPDINHIGSAGSFFKNPVIKREQYEKLKLQDPDLQWYPEDNLNYIKQDDPSLASAEYVKIPGGRLLDKLGWKGKRVGNVGVHAEQAMAIVAYDGAKPQEIVDLYKQMQADVQKSYGITLEPEVIIL